MPGANIVNVHMEGMRSIESGTGKDATSTGYGSERREAGYESAIGGASRTALLTLPLVLLSVLFPSLPMSLLPPLLLLLIKKPHTSAAGGSGSMDSTRSNAPAFVTTYLRY